ncbi:MAG: lytic transglycosylase domain-containing protein, partial [Pseudomonadales bacterium]|nr:lytic transglycosylase domain-containing protein [Pseudomonadales bacterium]
NRLKNIHRYLKSGADYRPAIISGFKRLVRKDYQLAHQLWPEYEAAFNFAPQAQAELFNYFARNMAVNYYPEAENWLDKALLYPDQQELLDYGIRHALRDYDWQRVKQWIAMLSPAERGSAQWRYWEAKAEQVIEEYNSPLLRFSADKHTLDSEIETDTVDNFEILGIHQSFMDALSHSDHFFKLLPNHSTSLLDNGFTPTELFDSLTYERGFYGFLASEKSKKPLPLNHAASILPQDRLNSILQHPGVIRARELYLINETTYAHREWYAAVQNMTLEQRGAAAHLAHLWGWHNQAIIAASRSDIHDNLELRFPKAYYETVSSHAQSRGLASDWVYSLIRQESAFSAGAKSGAGALGIMQIMPSTARQVSRSIGTPLKSNYQLLDPHHNIKIGTAYLGQLLNKFNGNQVLATAAYNAGPRRAKRWQPENHAMDGDIWIETIPIHETRNYVKNIFTYQAIYRHNLGLEPRLSDSLNTIQPKKNTAIATN